MFGEILARVQEAHPLIHTITNYVTANDCANIVLACGASPIMADEEDEVQEITALCSGLSLNLGTLNKAKIPALFLSGRTANRRNIPALLDPVGVGASTLRTNTALDLLREVQFTVIRANVSEMKALALGTGTANGVDASLCDRVTEENLSDAAAFCKAFSRKTGAVIAMTGQIDIVADCDRAYCIRNGNAMMSRVTGCGCQLSALTAAFVAADPDLPLEAAAAAVCAMGLVGEIAYKRLSSLDGNASYRNYIIDAIYHLTPEQLQEGANYELR